MWHCRWWICAVLFGDEIKKVGHTGALTSGKLHAFEMEYGYSKHRCCAALSSGESLLELNKQTLWEAWNSFACTVSENRGSGGQNLQTPDWINVTWHERVFYVIHFSLISGHGTTHITHYTCVCVSTCTPIFVRTSLGYRPFGVGDILLCPRNLFEG